MSHPSTLPLEGLIVVGIAGRRESGKDAVTRALAMHRGCTRIALGDPIKDTFDRLSGPGRDLHKDLDAAGETNGWAWQTLGDQGRLRASNPYAASPSALKVWIDLVAVQIAYLAFYHPVPRKRFVISDVRRKLEIGTLAEHIAHLGGRFATLRITRPDHERSAGRDDAHASEADCDGLVVDCDYVNDGPIEALHQAGLDFFDAVQRGAFREGSR